MVRMRTNPEPHDRVIPEGTFSSPSMLAGIVGWCMWMAQAKPERSCSGLKLVRHTESSAADVHQLQDRGLASGDRRQAVVGIGGSPRMAAAPPVLDFHQLNLQFLELTFVEITIQFDPGPLWMDCEIIEDRRGAVGVVKIKSTTAFGR